MHHLLRAAIIGAILAAPLSWLFLDVRPVTAALFAGMQIIGIIYGWVVRGWAEGGY